MALQLLTRTPGVAAPGAATPGVRPQSSPLIFFRLDFALTALFVVLAVDAYRARRDIPTPARP